MKNFYLFCFGLQDLSESWRILKNLEESWRILKNLVPLSLSNSHILDHFPSIFKKYWKPLFTHTKRPTFDLFCQKFRNMLGKMSKMCKLDRDMGQLFLTPCTHNKKRLLKIFTLLDTFSLQNLATFTYFQKFATSFLECALSYYVYLFILVLYHFL